MGAVSRFFSTPCIASAFGTGIGVGVLAGVAIFQFTSNVKKARRYAMWSYGLGTIVAQYNLIQARAANARKLASQYNEQDTSGEIHRLLKSKPEDC